MGKGSGVLFLSAISSLAIGRFAASTQILANSATEKCRPKFWRIRLRRNFIGIGRGRVDILGGLFGGIIGG